MTAGLAPNPRLASLEIFLKDSMLERSAVARHHTEVSTKTNRGEFHDIARSLRFRNQRFSDFAGNAFRSGYARAEAAASRALRDGVGR
jgi:hypothetical protein